VGLALALAVAMPSAAWAQTSGGERPSEGDMFGAAPATPDKAAPPAAPVAPASEPAAGRDDQAAPATAGSVSPADPAAVPAAAGAADATEARRDDAVLGSSELPKSTDEVAAEDPLRIGGQLYLRSASSMTEGQRPNAWSFSSPALLDAYLDARPNERVRAFARTRTSFDPTLPPNGTPASSSLAAGQAFPLFSSSSSLATRGPATALDQMWLRFDLKRAVFVTVGRQHVKWGTGKIWNPTDYLHPVPRNPLDLFDARTGSTMLKLHVPWEAKGWNFYGFALTESTSATSTVGKIAGAGRAELVFGPAELGLDVVVRDGAKPRYGADLSFGVGDIDFYGEVALRYGSEIDRVRYDRSTTISTSALISNSDSVIEALFPRYRSFGRKLQTVAGANYSLKYNDNDVLMFGAEYFYNQLGYDDPDAYLGVLLPRSSPLANPASFFYLGRNYLATFIIANAPYSWNLTTFRLTSLSNLSDNSHVVRFDYGFTLLTHLTFEAFVAGHFGASNGELRGGSDLFKAYGGEIKPRVMDLGVALRVAL
jgi:hypothetical protein